MKLSEKKMTEQRPPPFSFWDSDKKSSNRRGKGLKNIAPWTKYINKYTDISDWNMIFSLKIKFVLEPPFELTRLKEG